MFTFSVLINNYKYSSTTSLYKINVEMSVSFFFTVVIQGCDIWLNQNFNKIHESDWLSAGPILAQIG